MQSHRKRWLRDEKGDIDRQLELANLIKDQYVTKSKKTWMEYMNEQKIPQILEELARNLFTMGELPENPCAVFANRLRMLEFFASYTHFKSASIDICSTTEDETFKSLAKINDTTLYGRKEVIRYVNATAISHLIEQLGPSSVSSGKFFTAGYTCSWVTTLYGPIIFWGSVFQDLPTEVTLSHDFCVTGFKVDKAILLFANHVKDEMEKLRKAGNFNCEYCIHEPATRSNKDMIKKWTLLRIEKNLPSFQSAIKTAIMAKKKMFLTCFATIHARPSRVGSSRDVRGLDYQRTHFANCTIEYVFHLLQVNDQGSILGNIRSAGESHFRSLACGIVANRNDLFAYVDIFKQTQTSQEQQQDIDLTQSSEEFMKSLKLDLVDDYLEGSLMLVVEKLVCILVLKGDYSLFLDIKRLFLAPVGQIRALDRYLGTLTDVLEYSLTNRDVEAEPILSLIIELFREFRIRTSNLFSHSENSDMSMLRGKVRHILWSLTDNVSGKLLIESRTCIIKLRQLCFVFQALVASLERDSLYASDEISENGRSILAILEETAKEAFETHRGNAAMLEHNAKPGLRAIEHDMDAQKAARQCMRVVNVVSVARDLHLKGKIPADLSREATLLKYSVDWRLDHILETLLKDIMLHGKMYPNPYPFIASRFRAETMRQSLWTEKNIELLHLLAPYNQIEDVPHPLLRILGWQGVYGISNVVRFVDVKHILQYTNLLHTLISPVQGFPPCVENRNLTTSSNHSVNICTSISGNALLYASMLRNNTFDIYLRRNLVQTMFEVHVYDGHDKSVVLEMFGDNVLNSAVAIGNQANAVVVGVSTGGIAMDILEADPFWSGCWDAESRQSFNDQLGDANKYDYFRSDFTSGSSMTLEDIVCDFDDCQTEILRACRNSEPIVMQVFVTVEFEGTKYMILVNKIIGLLFLEAPGGNLTSYIPECMITDIIYQTAWLNPEAAVAVGEAISSRWKDESIPFENVHHPAWKTHCNKLKHRVAHFASVGSITMAHKVMLIYCLFIDDTKQVPDLARMIKPESIVYVLDCLADAYCIMDIALTGRNQVESLRKKISLLTLKNIFRYFRQNVERTLAEPECISLPGTSFKIFAALVRVEMALDQDRLGNIREHINKLYEIECCLGCIRTVMATSAHENCEDLHQMFTQFGNETMASLDVSNIPSKVFE